MKMEKISLKIAEQTNRLICNSLTHLVLIASIPLMYFFTGLEHAGFYLHCVVVLVLFVTASSDRSERLAIHAKLDEIIKTIPAARDELIQSHHLPASEIEELALDK